MTSDVLSDNDDLLHQLSAELGLPSFMDTEVNQVILLSLLFIIIIITIQSFLFSNTGLPTKHETERNLFNTFFTPMVLYSLQQFVFFFKLVGFYVRIIIKA